MMKCSLKSTFILQFEKEIQKSYFLQLETDMLGIKYRQKTHLFVRPSVRQPVVERQFICSCPSVRPSVVAQPFASVNAQNLPRVTSLKTQLQYFDDLSFRTQSRDRQNTSISPSVHVLADSYVGCPSVRPLAVNTRLCLI